MTEYEVYSYEAFRKKIRDDLRPVEKMTLRELRLKLSSRSALPITHCAAIWTR